MDDHCKNILFPFLLLYIIICSLDCPGESEVFEEKRSSARQAPKTPMETPKRPNVASPPHQSRGKENCYLCG